MGFDINGESSLDLYTLSQTTVGDMMPVACSVHCQERDVYQKAVRFIPSYYKGPHWPQC